MLDIVEGKCIVDTADASFTRDLKNLSGVALATANWAVQKGYIDNNSIVEGKYSKCTFYTERPSKFAIGDEYVLNETGTKLFQELDARFNDYRRLDPSSIELSPLAVAVHRANMLAERYALVASQFGIAERLAGITGRNQHLAGGTGRKDYCHA